MMHVKSSSYHHIFHFTFSHSISSFVCHSHAILMRKKFNLIEIIIELNSSIYISHHQMVSYSKHLVSWVAWIVNCLMAVVLKSCKQTLISFNVFVGQRNLQLTRYFVENSDGTFDLFESSKESQSTGEDFGKQPIRPFELKTFLKVGKLY